MQIERDFLENQETYQQIWISCAPFPNPSPDPKGNGKGPKNGAWLLPFFFLVFLNYGAYLYSRKRLLEKEKKRSIEIEKQKEKNELKDI